MSNRKRRTLVLILLFVLVLLALLFGRCSRTKRPASTVAPSVTPTSAAPATTPVPAAAQPDEVLTSATVSVPAQVAAGETFHVAWTGPNNVGDYVTLVAASAAATSYDNYAETKKGTPLDLTAWMNAGDYEVRYVTARSKTILGRAPLKIVAATATLTAPDEAVLGTQVSVAWTGPNHKGDYVTIVPLATPDGRYGNYIETAKGPTLEVTAPSNAGDGEIRYMSGQGAQVIARRPIKITRPELSLSAPGEVVAGKPFTVTWTGPNNPGDYVTIVPQDMPDGRYANYTETSKGSPLTLTALITPGDAELRYMTGAGARVLTRRSITINAAVITLEAPAEVTAGARVAITWTGPNNQGDYLTVVPRTMPDGQYARYADTSKGSPLSVESPLEAGDAEIRYMSGQGAKVLARRPLKTIPAQVTLQGPAEAPAGSTVSITWTGPNNPGDYLTVVPATAKDGTSLQTTPTGRGSPARVTAPREPGPAEIRYMSGQGNRVLGRTSLTLVPAK